MTTKCFYAEMQNAKTYASLKKLLRWKKRIRIIVYIDLERIMSDWGWGPHHITHQAAKVPLKQRYFPDECRGGGKFTHTYLEFICVGRLYTGH